MMPRNRTAQRTAFLIASLVAAAGASAQSTWSAPISGTWSDSMRWSPALVPLTPDLQVELGLAGAYEVRTETVNPNLLGLSLTNPDATLVVGPGRSIRVGTGGLVNDGLIRLNTTEENLIGSLRTTAPTTFSGSGQVLLEGPTPAAARIDASTELTFADGLTIRSVRGLLLGTFRNESVIEVDPDDGQLRIDGQIVQAPETGRLVATGTARIVLADGVLIEQGTVETGPQARLETEGDCTVREIRNIGTIDVGPGDSLRIGGSGLTNDGLIVVNVAGDTTVTRLTAADALIDGPGEIRLTGALISGAQIQVEPGSVLTIGEAQRVVGADGQINGDVLNHGTLTADPSGGTLMLLDEVEQSATGRLLADGNGAPSLVNATVIGGSIESANGGATRVSTGASTLRDTAISGRIDVGAGATVRLEADTTLDGTIVVNSDRISFPATLQASGRILGSGTIDLNGPDDADAILSGASFEIGPDVTITGSGGFLVAGSMTNRGLITVSPNFGFMTISSPVTQLDAGTIRGDGFGFLTIAQNGRITGGTIETVNGGFVSFTQLAALTDTVCDADMRMLPGAEIELAGTIVNEGSLLVNSSGSSVRTRLIGDDARIEGIGEIELNGPSAEWTGITGSLVLGTGQTVSGADSGLSGVIAIEGTLTPGTAGGPTGSLTVSGDLRLDPLSTTVIDVDATSNDTLVTDGAGVVELGGTLSVRLGDGVDPTPGLCLQIVDGTVTGAFDAVGGDPLPEGLVYRVSSDASGAMLHVGCVADVAAPCGELTIVDVLVYLDDWLEDRPIADIAEPFGQISIVDLLVFLDAWLDNCE